MYARRKPPRRGKRGGGAAGRGCSTINVQRAARRRRMLDGMQDVESADWPRNPASGLQRRQESSGIAGGPPDAQGVSGLPHTMLCAAAVDASVHSSTAPCATAPNAWRRPKRRGASWPDAVGQVDHAPTPQQESTVSLLPPAARAVVVAAAKQGQLPAWDRPKVKDRDAGRETQRYGPHHAAATLRDLLYSAHVAAQRERLQHIVSRRGEQQDAMSLAAHEDLEDADLMDEEAVDASPPPTFVL